MRSMMEVLSEQPLAARAVIVLAAFVGVLALDRTAVSEFTWPALFLIPVGLAAWLLGARFAMLAAVVADFARLALRLAAPQASAANAQEGGPILIFLAFAYVVAALREARAQAAERQSIDPLTGIPSHARFLEIAALEIHRAKRHRRPLTAVAIDIDDFRRVNGTMGQQAGDTLLKLVANTIRRNVRVVDIVARVGDDEFLLLLPETSREQAVEPVDRFQTLLKATVAHDGWPVTFSLAVVSFAEAPQSVDQMLREVDAALRAVKKAGKETTRDEESAEIAGATPV